MERVRDAAALSLREDASLGDMLAATRDKDAAVRYWGAIGIGNRGSDASQAMNRMNELLRDDSAVVRVAAARALCRMDRPEPALPTLVKILADGAQWERLHAIIALDEIDDMARPAIAPMKEALQYRDEFDQRGKYTVRVANRALNELLETKNTVP